MCHKSNRRESKACQTFQKSNFVRLAFCRCVMLLISHQMMVKCSHFYALFFFFHSTDVALMECSDFMQQLRSFKPQSLGSIVARRKSSTTLIFPLPPQACSGKDEWEFLDPFVDELTRKEKFFWWILFSTPPFCF